MTTAFKERLSAIDQEIRRNCEETLRTHDRSNAPALLQREKEFDALFTAFKELAGDTAESMTRLRKVTTANDGSEVYALAIGRWRALFRIDRKEKICETMELQELTWKKAALERLKHAYSPSLQ